MSILGPVNVLHEALDFHLARQNLLTANLAQVETPNYRAQELYRQDGFSGVLQAEMKVTDNETCFGGTWEPIQSLDTLPHSGPVAGVLWVSSTQGELYRVTR